MLQVRDALSALEGLTETARLDVMRPLEVLSLLRAVLRPRFHETPEGMPDTRGRSYKRYKGELRSTPL